MLVLALCTHAHHVSLQTLNIKDAYADDRFDKTVSNARFSRSTVINGELVGLYYVRNRSSTTAADVIFTYNDRTITHLHIKWGVALGPIVVGAGTRHLPPSRIHAPVTNPR